MRTETLPEVNRRASFHESEYKKNILTAAKGSGVMFLGTLFEYVGRFALGFLLARFLGAEHYGLYSLGDSAALLFISITMLGLDIGVVRYLSIFRGRNDHAALWGTIQIGLGLPFLLSLLASAWLWINADWVSSFFFHEPALTPLLRVVSLAIPCGALGASAVAITRGFKQMKYKVIGQDIILTLVKLALVLMFTITGLTAYKAMFAYSAASLVSCLVLLYFVYRLLPPKRKFAEGLSNTGQLFRFSLPAYITQLIQTLGPEIRVMLLGIFNTVTSVGIFTASSRINLVSSAFYRSVSVMSWPIVSDLFDRKEYAQLHRFYQTVTKWTFSFNLPIFLLILLFAQPILSILGNSFIAGSVALIILACGELVNSGTGNCATMVTMTGRTWLNAGNSLMSLVLNLAASAFLIPTWGATGAALATALSVIFLNVAQVLEVFFLYKMLPYNQSFLKPLSAGILAAAVGYALSLMLAFLPVLLALVIEAALLLGTYIALLLLFGLSEEDRMILNLFFAKLRRAFNR